MNLVTPIPAKPGDKIYIISPSAGIMPFTEHRVKRSVQHLENLGFKVVIAPNADKNSGYLSASIEDRVSDIHAAFMDDECTIIMAAIGGNHSNQLLPYLDYDLIAKHPKIFIGYSDNTVLHLALATQAGLQTYYGTCFLNQFGEYPEVLPYTLKNFRNIIMCMPNKQDILPSENYTDEVLDWFKNEDESRPRKLVSNAGFIWWKPGSVKGWALPGALPSLNHLLGTKYFPDSTGSILMIDIPEGHSMYEGQPVSEVDSWLTDLDNANVLSKINGLIISRPYRYSQPMIDELEKIVLRIVKDYSFPVLFNVDFGHTDPMITIPYGSKVSIDSSKNKLTLF